MLTVHVITPGIETTLAGSGVGSDNSTDLCQFRLAFTLDGRDD